LLGPTERLALRSALRCRIRRCGIRLGNNFFDANFRRCVSDQLPLTHGVLRRQFIERSRCAASLTSRD